MEAGQDKPLQEFITEAMWSIYEAVTELQRRAVHETPRDEKTGTWERMPVFAPQIGNKDSALASGIVTDNGRPVSMVEFDVAVVVGTKSGKSGGAGIMVAGFGLGGKKSTAHDAKTTSRLRFTIPVMWPAQSNITYLLREAEKKKSG